MSPELSYANVAADILKERGKVFIGYIAAGLEPYSAKQKPDISFVPAQGPNAGTVFFVELRLFESAQLPQHLPNTLREHRAFALEGAECEYAGFGFATNANLGPDSIQPLAESGIHYLGPMNGGEMLAEKISAWASGPADSSVG